MKITCLIIIINFHFAEWTIAQESNERWTLGVGVTYCSYIDSPGLNLSVTYRTAGNFHVGPDLSFLLAQEREENGRRIRHKEVEYNLNAHQIFDLGEHIALYPLTGINWSKVTTHQEGRDPEVKWLTGLNAGGGVELKLKRLKLIFEPKWVSRLNKFDLTTGIVLPL